MVKAIGGCLIVYASFMVGHAIGQLHGCMGKEMEEMLLFIQLFKGQIMYAGSELPEILADSAKRLKGNVGKWVNGLAEMSEKNRDRPFAELWTDSLAMLRRDSALSLEVLADVDRLGKIMGDMDVEAQLKDKSCGRYNYGQIPAGTRQKFRDKEACQFTWAAWRRIHSYIAHVG